MQADITHLFEIYREHARHLRNTGFVVLETNWDVLDDFRAVVKVLFEWMVLGRIPEKHKEIANRWKDIPVFLLEPSGSGFRVMISRNKESCGYWDHEIDVLLKGDAVIKYLDFFDFDQRGIVDFRYYLGRIIRSQKHPNLVGHSVLIETNAAKILMDAEAVAPHPI